jgi:hypothetical protein
MCELVVCGSVPWRCVSMSCVCVVCVLCVCCVCMDDLWLMHIHDHLFCFRDLLCLLSVFDQLCGGCVWCVNLLNIVGCSHAYI